MPDVHFWHSFSLFQGLPEYRIKNQLSEIVASEMNCLDDAGNWIEHDPYSDINVLTFAAFDSGCTKDVIIRIEAYDWPNRMINIKERLENIALAIAEMLPATRAPVAASFLPLPRGCWVEV